jgi:hypothetical protein
MAVIHPQPYAKFKPIFLDALKTRTEQGKSNRNDACDHPSAEGRILHAG